MKKLNDLVLFGAIALTGTFAFSSCSSSDDATADVNPTYDGESVKTQFAINIGNLGGNTTRMTEANTQSQATAVFLGLNSLRLLTFSGEPTAKTTPGTGESNTATSDITTLTDFTTFDNSSSNYKLYYNVSIPTGTKDFLFYAFGPQGDDSQVTGKLTADYGSNKAVSDIKFSLSNISETATKPDLDYVLKPIANAKVDDSNSLYWKDMDNTASVLSTLFKDFVGAPTSGSTYTAFNGSTDGILATVKLLVDKLNARVTSTATAYSKDSKTVTEGAAAKAILKVINGLKNGKSSTDVVFASTLATDGTLTITGWGSNTDWGKTSPKAYPSDLPAGAVPYRWAESNGTYSAEYINTGTTSGTTIGSSSEYVGTSNIVYPASLAYSCNTPAKATTSGNITWPNTAALWQGDSWTNWTDEVTASTTTVALKNNINYGIANLKFDVKGTYPSGQTGFKDNTPSTENGPLLITVSAEKPLKLTGILIGGQRQQADWQFMPITSDETNSPEVTIYADLSSESLAIKSSGTATTASYCLALDNLKISSSAAASDQDKVNIALEFENNTGVDFMGVDGLVANGQKFYLVGQLDPAATTGKTATSYQDAQKAELAALRYPYLKSDNTVQDHVFMQDFTTTANFSFSTLKNAYVNIPDLRTTKMVLGLSVNLAWQSGITFSTVTIGGSDND